MATRLRTLGPRDLWAIQEFLLQRPVENLFLIYELYQYGVDEHTFGFFHGFERDGQLIAVCMDGGTLFLAGIDPEAIPAFVSAVGEGRHCASILDPSMMALGLYLRLTTRFRGDWMNAVNVRQCQPLMALTGPPLVVPDPRVWQLTTRDFDSCLATPITMYTDEIGTSPYKHGPGYDVHVKDHLRARDTWGVADDGRAIFKADLGPRIGDHAQLQGVWLDPSPWGRGQSAALLSGTLTQVQGHHLVISLYVNDFNTPAIRLYERLGLQEIGSLSMVHYRCGVPVVASEHDRVGATGRQSSPVSDRKEPL